MLINHGLEPILEFWCGHPLPYVASAAVATCAVTLLFAPGTEKITAGPHFPWEVLKNGPELLIRPTVRRH